MAATTTLFCCSLLFYGYSSYIHILLFFCWFLSILTRCVYIYSVRLTRDLVYDISSLNTRQNPNQNHIYTHTHMQFVHFASRSVCRYIDGRFVFTPKLSNDSFNLNILFSMRFVNVNDYDGGFSTKSISLLQSTPSIYICEQIVYTVHMHQIYVCNPTLAHYYALNLSRNFVVVLILFQNVCIHILTLSNRGILFCSFFHNFHHVFSTNQSEYK